MSGFMGRHELENGRMLAFSINFVTSSSYNGSEFFEDGV